MDDPNAEQAPMVYDPRLSGISGILEQPPMPSEYDPTNLFGIGQILGEESTGEKLLKMLAMLGSNNPEFARGMEEWRRGIGEGRAKSTSEAIRLGYLQGTMPKTVMEQPGLLGKIFGRGPTEREPTAQEAAAIMLGAQMRERQNTIRQMFEAKQQGDPTKQTDLETKVYERLVNNVGRAQAEAVRQTPGLLPILARVLEGVVPTTDSMTPGEARAASAIRGVEAQNLENSRFRHQQREDQLKHLGTQVREDIAERRKAIADFDKMYENEIPGWLKAIADDEANPGLVPSPEARAARKALGPRMREVDAIQRILNAQGRTSGALSIQQPGGQVVYPGETATLPSEEVVMGGVLGRRPYVGLPTRSRYSVAPDRGPLLPGLELNPGRTRFPLPPLGSGG